MKKILPLTILISAFFITLNLQAGIITDPNKSILESNSFLASLSSNFANPDDIDTKFVIYINGSILNIKYNKPQELINGEVIVYNLLGQEITRKRLENTNINQITLSVQNTCYIVKINYSGKVHTQKVVPTAQ